MVRTPNTGLKHERRPSCAQVSWPRGWVSSWCPPFCYRHSSNDRLIMARQSSTELLLTSKHKPQTHLRAEWRCLAIELRTQSMYKCEEENLPSPGRMRIRVALTGAFLNYKTLNQTHAK